MSTLHMIMVSVQLLVTLSCYCLIQAEAEVKEIQKQLKRNMDEMENYKLLKYVIIIQYCTKSVCVCFFLSIQCFMFGNCYIM